VSKGIYYIIKLRAPSEEISRSSELLFPTGFLQPFTAWREFLAEGHSRIRIRERSRPHAPNIPGHRKSIRSIAGIAYHTYHRYLILQMTQITVFCDFRSSWNNFSVVIIYRRCQKNVYPF